MLPTQPILKLSILLCAASIPATIPLAFADNAQTAANRPNFVLFIGDDMTVDDFGCYGHPTIQTPNIDGLAADGIRFANAYQTTCSCSPVRTSLITGRYPHNTGAPELHMTNSPHLENLPQFPHLLREAGYYSAQAGKYHFNGDASKSFDSRADGGASGADNWIPTLQNRPMNKPFFMWFAANDAHRNWDQPLSNGPHGPEDVIVPPYLVDGRATRIDLAHYYNEIHRFDANIGRVVEELKQQGVYENTIIIILGEDGRPFPRGKCWLYDSGIKTPLIIHWPANINQPSVPTSLVSWIDLAPTILELADVPAPPNFQGVSLTPILANPNTSVRDFIFAERNWHVTRHHERMVRHGDFVYIRNNFPELLGMNLAHYAFDRNGRYGLTGAYVELVDHWRAGKATPAQENVVITPRPTEELYEVTTDPHQLNNLANHPDFTDNLAFLRKALDSWSSQTGDTIPELDNMTPDRGINRDDWDELGESSGRPHGGEVPGESTKAWTVNHPGPIHTDEINQISE